MKILSQPGHLPAGTSDSVHPTRFAIMRSLSAPSLALALASALLVTAGCGPQPTPEECEAFADKFVQLVREADDGTQGTDKLGAAMKTDVAKVCAQKGTKADIECVMAATTLDEVDAKCR